jgi:hypothetical protein
MNQGTSLVKQAVARSIRMIGQNGSDYIRYYKFWHMFEEYILNLSKTLIKPANTVTDDDDGLTEK